MIHKTPPFKGAPATAQTLQILATCLVLSGCAAGGPVASGSAPNYEGLVAVKRPRFDVAEVRPDTRFSDYDGVILKAPELAFKTPDRSAKEFPLTAEQKNRFQDALAAAFNEALGSLDNLQLTDAAAAHVLSLSIRVENITATVPPGRGPQLGFALTAVGEATLIIELRDSESGEILARGVDTRAIDGAAIRQGDEVITRWADVEKLCADWANKASAGLDVLVSQ